VEQIWEGLVRLMCSLDAMMKLPLMNMVHHLN
jgi:hypothetical protein